MNLTEYQPLALATAQPEALSLDYLVPGIAGETGELLGHMAKAHWHGTPAEQLQANLVKEYGDICWMAAVLLSKYGISFIALPSYLTQDQHPHVAVLDRAATLYREYAWGDTDLQFEAHMLWKTLHCNAEAITGHPLSHVLQVNLDKLASRAERGVLKGSGDDR